MADARRRLTELREKHSPDDHGLQLAVHSLVQELKSVANAAGLNVGALSGGGGIRISIPGRHPSVRVETASGGRIFICTGNVEGEITRDEFKGFKFEPVSKCLEPASDGASLVDQLAEQVACKLEALVQTR